MLSGGNGFNKTGAGTMTLSADQNYGGPTVVSGGVLKLQAVGASMQWTTGGVYSLASNASVGRRPAYELERF